MNRFFDILVRWGEKVYEYKREDINEQIRVWTAANKENNHTNKT